MKVICDIEANGLLLEVTEIHCIVCIDVDTGKEYRFSTSPALTDKSLEDFKKFTLNVETWVGHNWLAYDLFVLNKLLDIEIKLSEVEDTLVMSRLFMSGEVKQHSVEAYAKRLNLSIQKVKNEDWSQLTPLMLERCVADTHIQLEIYKYLSRKGSKWSRQSIRLEHMAQYLLTKQKIRGVYIDTRQAHELYTECYRQAESIRNSVQAEYQEVRKDLRTIRPRMVLDKPTGKKRIHGQDKRTLQRNLHDKNKDGTYTLYTMQEFNLDSPSQCVERLEQAGWKPIDFNKPSPTVLKEERKRLRKKGYTGNILRNKLSQLVGSPKINEVNLDTLPASAPQGAKMISEYKMLVNRCRTVRQWLDAVDEEGRLHGDVFSVGAWTQRCSHSKPNTANVPSVREDENGHPLLKKEGRYGYECRSCWTTDDIVNRRIVGVDAKSIQLRVLAHYMNDPDYTYRILNDDPHCVHRDLLGLPANDTGRYYAKRWIYAWLLGAGYGKLGRIMEGSSNDARSAEALLLENLPKLADLKKIQLKDVKRGYFRGLDGRLIPAKSDHLVMSAYLQGGEAVIMKKAYVDSCKGMKDLDGDIVAFVHDEFQTDAHLTDAEKCGMIMVEAINNTTNYFKLNCPMEGDQPKIAEHWGLTH